jgi:hypothetical protein
VQGPYGICLGELPSSCGFGPWCCWSVLVLFGVVLLGFVKGFLLVQVVLWRCFVTGP